MDFIFKKVPNSKKQKIKTVKVTTELSEHIYTPECFISVLERVREI